MVIQEKRDAVHRIVKSAYLSSQKFASTLEGVSADMIPEKLMALSQYYKKKQEECVKIENEMDKHAVLEEEKNHNEAMIQVVDYLGRKGMIRTVQRIVDELCMHDILSITPYVSAKKTALSILSSDAPVDETYANSTKGSSKMTDLASIMTSVSNVSVSCKRDVNEGVKKTEHVKQGMKHTHSVKDSAHASTPINSLGPSVPSQSSYTSIQAIYENAYFSRKFVQLCNKSTHDAVELYKNNRNRIQSKYLPLLVLSTDSHTYKQLVSDMADTRVVQSLCSNISYIHMNSTECLFYKRISLGISGFSTLACKITDESFCPGCTPKLIELCNSVPKSTRTITKIVCTRCKQLIVDGTPLFANRSGSVFCCFPVPPTETASTQTMCPSLKRCYFV